MFNFCSFWSNNPIAAQYALETYNRVTPNSKVSNNFTNSINANQSNLATFISENPHSFVRKILKSNYADLVVKHQETKEKYTDLQFPPNQKSIGNFNELENIRTHQTWKRISQIVWNPEFMAGRIEAAQILQSRIGNSYFSSVVAALAQQDYRLKNLFAELSINSYGIYMARIVHQGVFREVIVDDYVPVTPQGTPIYAKPIRGRLIWGMILQKCWAKLHGSYEAADLCQTNEILHSLTAAPTLHYLIRTNRQSQEQLWQKMSSADRDGYIICCGTRTDETSLEKCGLLPGHAYTVLGAFEWPQKLLKMRNLWGQREWNGRASDQDRQFWSRISLEQQQGLGHIAKKDASFFILYQDFINYFVMVDICKLSDNTHYFSETEQFSKKSGRFYQLTADEGSQITICVSQSCPQNKKGEEDFSRTTIVVAKQEQACKGYEYSYIDSNSTVNVSEQYIEIKAICESRFIIFVKCHWIKQNPQKATVSVYTTSKCNFSPSSPSKHQGFLYKTFLCHARKNVRKEYLSQHKPEWICNSLLINNCGYGYFVVHLDKSSARRIGVEIDESQFTEKRLVLKKPYKGRGKIKVLVQPGKQFIVLFRLKSQVFPNTITLPQPRIYNLV